MGLIARIYIKAIFLHLTLVANITTFLHNGGRNYAMKWNANIEDTSRCDGLDIVVQSGPALQLTTLKSIASGEVIKISLPHHLQDR